MQIWNDVLPPKRMRLLALMQIWDFGHTETRSRLAETLGISRRQLSRWVSAYNEGGIQGLIYAPRRRPGRKTKVKSSGRYLEIMAVIDRLTEGGERSSSVAEVCRLLKEENVITIGRQALARFLRFKGMELRKREEEDPRLVEEASRFFGNWGPQRFAQRLQESGTSARCE